MDDEEEKSEKNQSSMLKWILGGVAAGLIGLAGFAQIAFNTFMTRDEAHQNFLRQDMKAAVEKLSEVIQKSDERDLEQREQLIRAIDNQTRILESVRDDQRRGVWRATPIPDDPTKEKL